MANIVIPSLGESITEASIAKWHKKQGEFVTLDEIILEIETEKVTLEISAANPGILENILKQENEAVAVGEIVGVINENMTGIDMPAETKPKDTQAYFKENIEKQDTQISPSAKKLVTEKNLNIDNISASGPKGHILKQDVLTVLSEMKEENLEITKEIFIKQSEFASERPIKKVRMSKLRQTIALRLKESQNTAAILSTFNEVDMHNVMSLRAKYKDEFLKKYDVKLGFMSFFVKSVTQALKEVPAVNAEIIDNQEILYKYYYDIGVAVGTKQGLVVPVIKNAENLTFAEIEKTIGRLAKKARDNKLSMDDLTGGTFSITNGGIYGSLFSTPIINPPQAAILGMHNIVQKPVVIDGKIEIRPMMYLAVSYDHRLVDGKEAVTFLVKIKNAIENPERLLLAV